jgi:hypothetical protein
VSSAPTARLGSSLGSYAVASLVTAGDSGSAHAAAVLPALARGAYARRTAAGAKVGRSGIGGWDGARAPASGPGLPTEAQMPARIKVSVRRAAAAVGAREQRIDLHGARPHYEHNAEQWLAAKQADRRSLSSSVATTISLTRITLSLQARWHASITLRTE